MRDKAGEHMQTYHILIDTNQKDTTKHGVFEFPVAIYHTQINKNVLGFIDWHWHDELQLCLVVKGQVEFQVNEDKIILSEGEGLYINKGQMHKARNYKNHDSTYICVDFQANLISGFEGSIVGAKYVEPYINNAALPYLILKPSTEWQQKILSKIYLLAELYENKIAGYELEVHIQLQIIWQFLVKNYFALSPVPNVSSEKIRCKAIVTYVQQHYMEKVTLEQLSKVLSLSQGACCREFKKYMKCTIFEYLMNYRINMSAKMLLTTDASITDIAYKCGFNGASYFIEQFKKKTGETPYTYKNARNINEK